MHPKQIEFLVELYGTMYKYKDMDISVALGKSENIDKIKTLPLYPFGNLLLVLSHYISPSGNIQKTLTHLLFNDNEKHLLNLIIEPYNDVMVVFTNEVGYKSTIRQLDTIDISKYKKASK